jgi:hypothetical protein
VKILMALYLSGVIDDQKIADACEVAGVKR